MPGRDEFEKVAEEVIYDPNKDPDCDLISENTQDVIDELCKKANLAASPGFSWGRGGTHTNGTWLKNNDVISNKTGLPFGLNNGFIKKVTIDNLNTGSIFDVKIWYHFGNLTGAVLLTTITTTGASTIEDFVVSVAIPKDVMLAIEIDNVGQSASPSPKETQVFLVIKGNV